MENELLIEEMKPLLRPLFAALQLAADTIANDAPMCAVTESNRERIIRGSLETADALLLALDEPAAEPVQPVSAIDFDDRARLDNFEQFRSLLERVSKEALPDGFNVEILDALKKYDLDSMPF